MIIILDERSLEIRDDGFEIHAEVVIDMTGGEKVSTPRAIRNRNLVFGSAITNDES